MYPSGIWKGFWQQEGWGQQPMEEFELYFSNGIVTGQGVDMVGRFTFDGEYDQQTGLLNLVKKYVGRHTVNYVGQPNGEGAIVGRWSIVMVLGEHRWESSGPFLLQPELPKPTEHDPVYEIRPRGRG